MNRKMIVIGTVLLAAVAGWCLWSSPPEYGDSYSEQQRKLWNERRALYPMAWGQGMNYDLDSWGSVFLTGLNRSDAQLLFEQKKKRDEELAAKQIQLRDREKLGFQMDQNVPSDCSPLPVSQVSVRECLERARDGDVDACMMMALHMGWRGKFRSELLTWRRAHDVRYWLDKAEELKHPGCQFLKNFMMMILPENRKNAVFQSGGGLSIRSELCPDYTGLPGYPEWQQCLRDGDLLAYQLFCWLAADHELPDREKKLLLEGLRSRSKSGDVLAMEKMCSLIFEPYRETDWRHSANDEMSKSIYGKMISMLPESVQEPAIQGFVRLGIVNAENTETMREFREAATCARESARRGSMIGMAFWLRYGQESLKEYSREDWEEVFRYHRILWERAYVPYVRDWGKYYPLPLDQILMESYYSPQSLRTAYRLTWAKSGMRDEDVVCGGDYLAKGKNAAEVLCDLDEQIAFLGADYVLEKVLVLRRSWNVAPEITEAYAAKVRELATEGDPLAKLVLGYLYENGLGVSRDLGMAWNLYSEARVAMGIFGVKLMTYLNLEGDKHVSCSYLEMMPSFFMLSLGIRNADFPGRDEAQMYALAQELELFSISNDYLSYLLGRVYEDGIGTPVDLGKARMHYERGRYRHAGCAERLERLGEDELDSSEQN